jgi:hypothetical protein
MSEPKLGDFFVARTNGKPAEVIRWGTNSSVNHAGVYVGNGKVVEAEPGGANYGNLSSYSNALWSTDNLPADLVPTDSQRAAIVQNAIKCIGIPYGDADIVAIAAAQKMTGFIDPTIPIEKQPFPIKQILQKIRDSHTLICSQLVDLCYNQAGVHLFTDGRFEGLVSPEDLRALLIKGIIQS